ncbi:MAG: ATP-binding protein [Thermodesulfobacteriota bacterium]|nr:ATP-binding protein [Thermodesulfobacteriota bacterium]
MKRDLYNELLKWKNDVDRKPLILKGARQVGKTYILNAFGRNEYHGVAYFNFEGDPNLNDFFQGKIQTDRIIEKLSIYLESNIDPEKTLIIFDEIQNSPETLNSLKYFHENANQYHIVSAGSLLGIKVGQSAPFPVGKVNFLDLFPFSFREFLNGIGKSQLRNYLQNKKDFQPIEASFHADLTDFLRLYFFIGGMPEAILKYKTDGDLKKVRKVQSEILSAYAFDFSKYASKSDAIKITSIWNAIPGQLAKENKKFMFSQISKNARSRDYAEALQWLVDAGLVYKSYNVKVPKIPLSGYREENIFKIFLFDIGLLGSMIDLSQKTIMEKNRLFSEYNGAFTESFVAQELKAHNHKELYYWTAKSSAEIDFLLQLHEQIFPLEVKSGFSKKKKSLKIYAEKYQPDVLSRATLMNFKHDGIIKNYPLYGISLFPNE